MQLDKEMKIKEIEQEVEKLRELEKREKISLDDAINALLERKRSLLNELDFWDRVFLARHSQRPYTLDYIENVFDDFTEFHGDRLFGDDPSLITGFGRLDGIDVCIVGHQKGRGTEEKIERNFGMPHPEGYRKAARIFKLADKFNIPVITLIDTPGAYPGIEAEKRGQAVAIAENLKLMFKLNVPIVACIIGEGGSGGALGIAVADHIVMLENSVYSVISPEGCASILWRDVSYAREAASNLKMTAADLIELKVIDHIIKEPAGGVHKESADVYSQLKEHLKNKILQLRDREDLIPERIEKFRRMGIFKENS